MQSARRSVIRSTRPVEEALTPEVSYEESVRVRNTAEVAHASKRGHLTPSVVDVDTACALYSSVSGQFNDMKCFLIPPPPRLHGRSNAALELLLMAHLKWLSDSGTPKSFPRPCSIAEMQFSY